MKITITNANKCYILGSMTVSNPGTHLGREVPDFPENITFKLISTGCLEGQTIPGREKMYTKIETCMTKKRD